MLDSRDPLSVTLPLGRELWGESDVVLGVGSRLFYGFNHWGIDRDLAIIRIDADPEEPERFARPAVALIGDAKPILRRLIDALPGHRRASRRTETLERQQKMRKRLAKLAPQIDFLDAIRAELPEDGILIDEVTQIGFAARLLFPVYRPRTFLSPVTRTISVGFRNALALNTRDRTCGCWQSRATAVSCSRRMSWPPPCSPHSVDGGGVQRRRVRQCAAHPGGTYGNRVIASDLANPDFVRYAKASAPRANARATPNSCARRSSGRSSAATAPA